MFRRKLRKSPQASTREASRLKSNFHYAFFLLAWVTISMTASQFAIGLPMRWILGPKFSQPFFTCVFYGLTYVLALILVVFVPPKFIAWAKSRDKKSATKVQKAEAAANEAIFPNDLKTSRAELGLTDLPSVVDVLLTPIAYFAYLVLAQIFTTIFSGFAWFDAKQTQDVGFGYFVTSFDRIVAMLALVFIAPIAEEIIMRGWLYGKLREKLKIPAAIILTSLLFGFLHGQWNVGVGVFALSLVLCGLREITGTIYSGILLHILSNGIAFYLMFIAM